MGGETHYSLLRSRRKERMRRCRSGVDSFCFAEKKCGGCRCGMVMSLYTLAALMQLGTCLNRGGGNCAIRKGLGASPVSQFLTLVDPFFTKHCLYEERISLKTKHYISLSDSLVALKINTLDMIQQVRWLL